jgi:multidrug efflux system outer membrane protein
MVQAPVRSAPARLARNWPLVVFTPVLALALSACTAGPDYHPASAGDLKVPGRYNAAPAASPSGVDIRTWWTSFDDPVLDRLIGAALTANNDIDAARARLRAARSSVARARGALLPSIGATAGSNRTLTIAGDDGDSESYRAGFDASWEADIFGGNKRSVEAARASAETAAAELHSVQLSIAAELALNYITLRATQASLANARTNLGYQDETVEIAGWRVQAGLVSSLDLEQSRVLRAQTAASIPALETSLEAAANHIAVLTGEAPGAVAALLEQAQPIPLGPDAIQTGLPAELLQRRPDVVSAERRLAAETARIGVATAQLYPALRLSGSLTTSSLTLGGLGGSILGGLASAITAPIFQGGQIRAQIEGQRATTDAAFANYRQTVLIALEDVENALVALQNARLREDALGRAEGSAQTSLLYARSQYRAGLIDFQRLLESERSVLSAQDARVNARAARATALVQLYKALGGGWSPDDITPEMRP